MVNLVFNLLDRLFDTKTKRGEQWSAPRSDRWVGFLWVYLTTGGIFNLIAVYKVKSWSFDIGVLVFQTVGVLNQFVVFLKDWFLYIEECWKNCEAGEVSNWPKKYFSIKKREPCVQQISLSNWPNEDAVCVPRVERLFDMVDEKFAKLIDCWNFWSCLLSNWLMKMNYCCLNCMKVYLTIETI